MRNRYLDVNVQRNTFLNLDIMQGYTLLLKANIFDNDTPFENLNDYVITIEMRKADNTVIIQSDGYTIEENNILIKCNQHFTAISGQAKLQIVLSKDGVITGSWAIDVNVLPSSVCENDEVSQNTATIIESLRLQIQEANNVNKKLSDTINTGKSEITNHANTIRKIIEDGNVVSNKVFNDFKSNINTGNQNYFPLSSIKGHGCNLNFIGNLNSKIPYYDITVSNSGVGNNFGMSIEGKSFNFHCDTDFYFTISFWYRILHYKCDKPMQSYMVTRDSSGNQTTYKILENFTPKDGDSGWQFVSKTFKAKSIIANVFLFYVYTDTARTGTQMYMSAPTLNYGTVAKEWNNSNFIESNLEYRGLIGDRKNLNDFVNINGVYLQDQNSHAQNGTNYPTRNAGFLTVFTSNGFTQQRYNEYNVDKEYTRTKYLNTWSNWQEVIKTNSSLCPKITEVTAQYTSAIANGTAYITYNKIGNQIYVSWNIIDLRCNNQNTSYANFRLPFDFSDYSCCVTDCYKINGGTYDHWHIAQVGTSANIRNNVLHINVQGLSLNNGDLQTVGISGFVVAKV